MKEREGGMGGREKREGRGKGDEEVGGNGCMFGMRQSKRLEVT